MPGLNKSARHQRLLLNGACTASPARPGNYHLHFTVNRQPLTTMNKSQYPDVCHTRIPTCDIITTAIVSFRDVEKRRRRVLTAADRSREVRPSILEWRRRFEENLARVRRDKVVESRVREQLARKRK